MNIFAVIPAHNEAKSIGATVRSLYAQTVKPTHILVVCDNCTDNTAKEASRAGAVTLTTKDNHHRKAGALNQALPVAMKSLSDVFLIMDADTVLVPTWIEDAARELEDRRVGGVGAVFEADRQDSYLTYCQSLEWARYAEEIDRTKKTFVLSGTAALIRRDALNMVRAEFGRYYDVNSITEDFRMTVDLTLTGWELRSPNVCRSITETMPTVATLFRQRRRWSLGAMQTVAQAGFTRPIWPYIKQQLMIPLGILCMALYLLLSASYAVAGVWALSPFWLAVGLIFVLERVITVWHMGWKARAFAALIVPELAYALILQAAHVAAMLQFMTGSKGTWSHI